jgi:hypothetical protein
LRARIRWFIKPTQFSSTWTIPPVAQSAHDRFSHLRGNPDSHRDRLAADRVAAHERQDAVVSDRDRQGLVFLSSGEPPDDVNMANRTGDRFLEIWPVRVGNVEWPPEHTFTYEELTGLSNMVPATP